MSFSKEVLAHVRAYPGATSLEVAEWFKVSVTRASGELARQYNNGRFTREPVSKTLTNRPIYAYTESASNVTRTPTPRKVRNQEAHASVAPSLSMDRIVDTWSEALVEQLADRIVAAVKDKLQDKVKTALQSALPAALPHPPAPKQEVMPARKRVLVVGLLPQQAGMIAREFGECLDLDFVEQTKAGSTLRDKVNGQDAVIAMVKFISHDSEQMIQAKHGNLIRCPGGLSHLRDILTEQYVK